jgi:hypothetical protein
MPHHAASPTVLTLPVRGGESVAAAAVVERAVARKSKPALI